MKAISQVDNTLAHFGILGMKWGVRRYQNTDGTLTEIGKKRIYKEASKDAQRHIDAKLAYGIGAGTRRKLLKAEIEPKLKDPFYAKSFDDALSKIDTAKSAAKARTWRRKQDTKDQAIRSTKQVAKYITGTTSLAAIGLAYIQYKPQVDYFLRKSFEKLKYKL